MYNNIISLVSDLFYLFFYDCCYNLLVHRSRTAGEILNPPRRAALIHQAIASRLWWLRPLLLGASKPPGGGGFYYQHIISCLVGRCRTPRVISRKCTKKNGKPKIAGRGLGGWGVNVVEVPLLLKPPNLGRLFSVFHPSWCIFDLLHSACGPPP